jgi:hypothetical protein
MSLIRRGGFIGLLLVLVLLSQPRTTNAVPAKDGCDTECQHRFYFTDGSPGDCWAYDPQDCNWCKNVGRCTVGPGLELPDCIKVKGKDGKYLQTKRTFYALGSCSPLCIPAQGMYAEATVPNGTPDVPQTLDLHVCDIAP